MGLKSKRQVNLLSNLELDFFLYADFSDNVVDIREQFAFRSLNKTLNIAKKHGIVHNRDNQGQPVRITIDFLLTIKEGMKRRCVAVMVKPSSALNKQRVIEKFNLAYEICKEKGYDFVVVTERELNRNVTENLKLFRATEAVRNFPESAFIKLLKTYGKRDPEMTIKSVVQLASEQLSTTVKDGIKFFLYLCLKKKVVFDYTIPFKNSHKLQQIAFV
jgi:hypothetical protein